MHGSRTTAHDSRSIRMATIAMITRGRCLTITITTAGAATAILSRRAGDFSHDEMCCARAAALVTPPTSAPNARGSPPRPSHYARTRSRTTTICLSSRSSPSPTITCDTATAFSIDSGDCTACGACFHTPNYLAGSDYHHGHHDCTITALQDGYLDVWTSISTSYWWQCAYDVTIVDGVRTAEPTVPRACTSPRRRRSRSTRTRSTRNEDGISICSSSTLPAVPRANP